MIGTVARHTAETPADGTPASIQQMFGELGGEGRSFFGVPICRLLARHALPPTRACTFAASVQDGLR